MENLFVKNKYFFITVLTIFLGCLIVVITNQKTTTHLWINQFNSGTGDFVFRYLTHLGDGISIIIVIIPLLFVQRNIGLYLGLSSLLASGIIQFLKQVIFSSIKRPHAIFADYDALHRVEGMTYAFSNSFPSGHTTAAFCLTTCLVIVFKNKKVWPFLLVYAVLIGYSRIYLSQHFLEDVTAGIFLGVCIPVITYFLLKDKLKLNA